MLTPVHAMRQCQFSDKPSVGEKCTRKVETRTSNLRSYYLFVNLCRIRAPSFLVARVPSTRRIE